MSKRFRLHSLLVTKMEMLGVSPAAVLRTACLPPGLFDQARILVTTEQLFALWRGIEKVSRDPAMGLKLAAEENLERHDPIAMVALCARYLGEAFRQMARYKQLTCPEEIVVENDSEECSVQFRWLLATGAEPDMLLDLCFGWVLSIARRGTGVPLTPLRLELARHPAHGNLLRSHFGCPVMFEAGRNALVFNAADLDRPFVTHNADLLAMIIPQLDEELTVHRSQESFPEQVKGVIKRRLAGQRPSVQEVAQELHMSARTLQRRLQNSGVSFQQVLEDSRHELARHYLMHSALELNETAYLLGYEDANSFVRAFHDWTGSPPARWREAKQLQLQGDSTAA